VLALGGKVGSVAIVLLRVTQLGEDILRAQGQPVTEFGERLRTLSEDMLETMYASEGIGLAAQQVDENLQLFVLDMQVRESEPDFEWRYDGKAVPLDILMPLVMVNAQVTPQPSDLVPHPESCLSLPGIGGVVARPDHIKVEFQDIQGQPHILECTGYFARVIQHEYDHTKGILITDHFTRQDIQRNEKKLKKIKRATRDYLRTRKKLG